MPVVGAAAARELEPLLGGDCPVPDAQWLDIHTHTGQSDPDGIRGTDAELLAALDDGGVERALVFSSHEPSGYAPANDRVREEAAQAGGRLDWLGRVDPNADGALDEARRCLDLGARGIKLHPRSDGFGLPHPVVDAVAAEVAARGLVLLFHSGRGIPNLGEDCVLLAERHPELRIVLAHAGISDLGLLPSAAARLPNLLFDTAWWTMPDLLVLTTSIPPGRVLYASDMPYGPATIAGFLFARATRAAGWTVEQARHAAGPQLERILDGDGPLDLGPAVGLGGLEPRSPALERVMSHTATAVYGSWRGVDPAEPIALARLGCQVVGDEPHAELLGACDRLLAHAEERLAATGDWRDCVDAVLAVHACAATPEAGAPETNAL